MINPIQFIKHSMFVIPLIALVGCTIRPVLSSAHLKKGASDTETVEVVISVRDAKMIKDREIYFSIVIVDCKNHENRFPIEPYISGNLATKFNFPLVGEFITVQGVVPKKVMVEFLNPCVALQGGSYIFGSIDSPSIPLVIDQIQ